MADFEADFMPIYEKCQPFTMTSQERLYALYKATEYISAARIPGSIVECGVWKGGSAMCAALTLMHLQEASRKFYLYDTFEGMVPPTDVDVDINGKSGADHLEAEDRTESSGIWAYSPLDAVQNNMKTTSYPSELISYIKGPVEDTIPGEMPSEIAILRLDTDWYASTKHELENLFPRLVVGGVMIIDDYGHWQGSRRAVDEYIANNNIRILLNRIDYTGRIAVKLSN